MMRWGQYLSRETPIEVVESSVEVGPIGGNITSSHVAEVFRLPSSIKDEWEGANYFGFLIRLLPPEGRQELFEAFVDIISFHLRPRPEQEALPPPVVQEDIIHLGVVDTPPITIDFDEV